MELEGGGITLKNISKFNVLLGKNGCGKSTALKRLEEGLDKSVFGKIRYISPERGGFLNYEAGIQQAMANQPTWMSDTRRKNQSADFRQQSATLFRLLEMLVLREIERDQFAPDYKPRTFDEVIAPIGELLERIYLERDNEKAFNIIDRETDSKVGAETVSSGESELISLAIECLSFRHECDPAKINVLLIDEPDVHLHPDLQNRLAQFMISTFHDTNMILVLATHSTALLAGLAYDSAARISFMSRRQVELQFHEITEAARAILPIFGAHPLSNIFNEAPILLIEGEDDERVWQQAVRSAGGKIRVYPCVVDGNSHFAEFEAQVNELISAVYDNACAFSLRDRDIGPEAIDDVDHVLRMRLSCRAAENLMLTDDVLAHAQTDWPSLCTSIEAWIENNGGHQFHSQMVEFSKTGFDRKGFDLKEIRNILLGLISTKPWEVLVGQAIAKLAGRGRGVGGDNELAAFLGSKVCNHLLNFEGVQ